MSVYEQTLQLWICVISDKYSLSYNFCLTATTLETLTYKNIGLFTFDVGGKDDIDDQCGRPMWKYYIRNTQGY